MAEREYLFDAVTGFYLADRPVGHRWGWKELDGRDHTVVRTSKPEFLDHFDDLRNHKLKLVSPLNHSGRDNIFLDGVLAATPEKDHVLPPVYVNIRTGAKQDTEEAMWSGAEDGDMVWFTRSAGNLDLPGWVLMVESVAEKRVVWYRADGITAAQRARDTWSKSAVVGGGGH